MRMFRVGWTGTNQFILLGPLSPPLPHIMQRVFPPAGALLMLLLLLLLMMMIMLLAGRVWRNLLPVHFFALVLVNVTIVIVLFFCMRVSTTVLHCLRRFTFPPPIIAPALLVVFGEGINRSRDAGMYTIPNYFSGQGSGGSSERLSRHWLNSRASVQVDVSPALQRCTCNDHNWLRIPTRYNILLSNKNNRKNIFNAHHLWRCLFMDHTHFWSDPLASSKYFWVSWPHQD